MRYSLSLIFSIGFLLPNLVFKPLIRVLALSQGFFQTPQIFNFPTLNKNMRFISYAINPNVSLEVVFTVRPYSVFSLSRLMYCAL